ncbi:hypothetical protein [Rhodococcus sp. AH-ZY2]|uniref:hypothetical protein n=1 Tax=Rhodococcus sp. AH-ZY2 TaxID=3047468 RepID=UPI0027E0694D|nr:hypothetical protein [Rhodococcus sp. AH-ZY2]WML64759.1 hypothetical protein QNA09_08205 [Rhodococcus sp. AH-ZY2]
MTNNDIPNPLPSHAMIVDDDGQPRSVVDIDRMQSDSIELAYEMAMHCGDEDALDAISSKWLDRVGVEGFGYVTAGALRMMTHFILDPTLQTVDQLAPQLRFRDKLVDAYRNSKATL